MASSTSCVGRPTARDRRAGANRRDHRQSDFTIYAQLKTGSASWTDLSTDDLKTTFDRARCLCGSTVRFVVEAADSTAMSKVSALLASSRVDGEGHLYLGQSSTGTTDPTDSSYDCVLLDQIEELDGLASNGYWVSTEVSVADLFASAGHPQRGRILPGTMTAQANSIRREVADD